MKILPLALIAGGAYFLMNKKKPTSTDNQPVKGYEIKDCTQLIIYDRKKALDYAFSIGQKVKKSDDIESLLFGKCLKDPKSDQFKKLINTKEKAVFIFDLVKYSYSGFVSNNPEFENFVLTNLEAFKVVIDQILGFDISDSLSEIIVKTNTKPNPGSKEVGYSIKDCINLTIYDQKTALDHSYNLGTIVDNPTKIDDILFGGCFENAKDENGIKKIISTPEKAKFVFEMMKYAYSGFITKSENIELETEQLLKSLNDIKLKLTTLGFNTSDFKVELVKKV